MKIWIGIGLCIGLRGACTAQEDRISFDGQLFNAKVRKVERQIDVLTVTVKPVLKSLKGALEAGTYEAAVYCVESYGSSDIIWVAGPDVPEGQLNIEKDTLTLQGRCSNAR